MTGLRSNRFENNLWVFVDRKTVNREELIGEILKLMDYMRWRLFVMWLSEWCCGIASAESNCTQRRLQAHAYTHAYTGTNLPAAGPAAATKRYRQRCTTQEGICCWAVVDVVVRFSFTRIDAS